MTQASPVEVPLFSFLGFLRMLPRPAPTRAETAQPKRAWSISLKRDLRGSAIVRPRPLVLRYARPGLTCRLALDPVLLSSCWQVQTGEAVGLSGTPSGAGGAKSPMLRPEDSPVNNTHH